MGCARRGPVRAVGCDGRALVRGAGSGGRALVRGGGRPRGALCAGGQCRLMMTQIARAGTSPAFQNRCGIVESNVSESPTSRT